MEKQLSPTKRGTVRLCGSRHISTSGLGVPASRSGVVYCRFCNLLLGISRLSTIRVAFDVKRRLPTLFPVLPKPEVVFNSQSVVGPYIVLYESRIGSWVLRFPPYFYFRLGEGASRASFMAVLSTLAICYGPFSCLSCR